MRNSFPGNYCLLYLVPWVAAIRLIIEITFEICSPAANIKVTYTAYENGIFPSKYLQNRMK